MDKYELSSFRLPFFNVGFGWVAIKNIETGEVICCVHGEDKTESLKRGKEVLEILNNACNT